MTIKKPIPITFNLDSTSGAMVAMSDCVWTPSASEYNGNSGNQMDLTNVAYVRIAAKFANSGTVNNPPEN